MVKKGQKAMAFIDTLSYEPSQGYPHDVEVFTVSDLRKRFGYDRMKIPYRYAFGMVLLITKGKCEQSVDFQKMHCRAGDLIVVSAGQAHRFGNETDWEGQIVLFRAESVPELKKTGVMSANPQLLQLHEGLSEQVLIHINQLRIDSKLEGSKQEVNKLLQLQLRSLLARIAILTNQSDAACEQSSSRSYRRYNEFSDMLEKHYMNQPDLNFFAAKIGCSVKSLSRSVFQFSGLSAKKLMTKRIVLEAKRLLVHSDMNVGEISEALGFDEPTNFIKFFKRSERCTPGEFRDMTA